MCVRTGPGRRRACAHQAYHFGVFQTCPTQASPPASAYPEPDPLGTCHSPPNPEPPENSVIFRIWPSAKADRGIGPVICRCRALPLSPPVSGSRRTACYKQNLAPPGGGSTCLKLTACGAALAETRPSWRFCAAHVEIRPRRNWTAVSIERRRLGGLVGRRVRRKLVLVRQR